jgi:hypothetical protein
MDIPLNAISEVVDGVSKIGGLVPRPNRCVLCAVYGATFLRGDVVCAISTLF